MARPIWKGAITFGLVSIPIEVHTAVRDKQLHFHLLTAKDHVRVKYERVSEKTHKPVAWNDLVKGYEYSKGRYVVLTPEDFEAAALAKTRTIDILDFVKAEEVDDRFFDKPYYVTAGAGGDRAYALLRETIRDAGEDRHREVRAARPPAPRGHRGDRGCAGPVDAALRGRADPCLRVLASRRRRGSAAGDLKTARMLVDELSADWNPEKYTDDYRQNLVRIIDARKKGQEATLEPEESDRSGNVVDLMERLRASLEGGARRQGRARQDRKAAGASRAKRTKPAPAKAKRRAKRAA